MKRQQHKHPTDAIKLSQGSLGLLALGAKGLHIWRQAKKTMSQQNTIQHDNTK